MLKNIKNIEKKKLLNRSKKYLVSGISIFSLFIITSSLTACGVSKTLVNSLIITGDRKKFFNSSEEFNLNKIARLSLQTDIGYNKLLEQKVGDVLLSWYKNNDDINFCDKYQDWEIEVDNAWNEKIKDLKKEHGDNYKVYLQKDFLDPAGGTRSEWKHKELITKAIADFKNQLFLINYLNYYENYKNYKGERTLDGVYIPKIDDKVNWKNLQFATDDSQDKKIFSSEMNVFFAKIQESIFKKWVKNEIPLLVSSVLFKYSLPKNGISSIYNDAFFPALSTSPSYEFPTFTAIEESDDNNINQEQRFKSFVRNLASYYSQKNDGVNFSQTVNDDTNSGSFVTLNSLFSDSDVRYASSIAYIFGKNLGVFSNNFKMLESDLSKQILLNFVNSNKDSSGYFDDMIFKKDAVSDVIKNNPNSNYKYYETDIFNSKNSIADVIAYKDSTNQLTRISSNLVLTRMTDGVRAFAIDGKDYFIDPAKHEINFDNLETFLKYRSVQKSKSNNENNVNTNNVIFSIYDQIKNYFENDTNTYKLLYELINEGFFVTKKLSEKNISEILFGSNELELKNLISRYNEYHKLSTKKKNSLLVRTKFNSSLDSYYAKLFSKNSSHLSLGLTGRMPFITLTDGTIQGLESVVNNWWVGNQNNKKPLAEITTEKLFSEYESSRTEYLNAVTKYIDSLNLINFSPAAGDEYYFNYSQQIFTSDSGINQVINDVISNSDNKEFFSEIKYDVFKKQLDGFFNIDTGKFVDSNSQIQQDLELAVLNTYKLKAMQDIRGNNTNSYSYGYISSVGNLADNKNKFVEKIWHYATLNKTIDLNDYYSFIYAIKYLLSKDSLGNIRIKNYLDKDIPFGKQGYVVWAAPTSVSDRKVDRDIFKMPINPNDYFGDFGSKNRDSFKNYIVDNSQAAPTLLSNDEYNNLINPYKYASHKSVFNSNSNNGYGFLGLDINDSSFNSFVPEGVHNQLFENFQTVKSGDGLLFGYTSKERLFSYIDSFLSKSSLIRFAQELNKLYDRININKIVNSTSENFNLDSMKKNLKISIEIAADQNSFNNASGFIGKNYIGSELSTVINGMNTPLNYNNSIGYYSYIVPLNNDSVGKINSEYSTNEESRLGLDLSTFFQIVCQYAMTTEIKSIALSDMLMNSGGRILSYDQRLVNVLGTEWTYVAHVGSRN